MYDWEMRKFRFASNHDWRLSQREDILMGKYIKICKILGSNNDVCDYCEH
jgi:hypothetical protein